jgi:hypothetical protein
VGVSGLNGSSIHPRSWTLVLEKGLVVIIVTIIVVTIIVIIIIIIITIDSDLVC